MLLLHLPIHSQHKPDTTFNFSCIIQLHILHLVKPILTQTLSLSLELSYSSSTFLIACLSMSLSSLFPFSCIFIVHFVLQLQTSTPTLTCFFILFIMSLFSLLVPCLLIYHASLPTTSIAHLVMCPSRRNLTCCASLARILTSC